MPTHRGVVPLEQLRRVIAARLAAVSLRALAREVGMSPTGLQKFIDGAVPYHLTREKLERWFVRQVAEGRAETSPGAVLAALEVLVRDLPPDRQDSTRAALVREMRRAYEAAPPPRPSWLGPLADEVEPEK